MLKLTDIVKNYVVGENVVHALRSVSMSFRKSEFVSILGASGCGKTTLLNVIGGLDKYDSGDLSVNGKSTKHFRDRDWDTYRNHSVGFVFQSYHLIPHQSVLQNVKIALALSGVKKGERRERAKKALIQVGLGSEIYKKPNQLSGGQMQRVAIARALVNNPDIVLADEPTGALDSETSVQIMEILKEISKERLVVMVTHNPDLAEYYSTRIIKMQDGRILSDSNPLSQDEEENLVREDEILQKTEREKDKKRTKRPSMSIWTSFTFSLKNLFSKKGRTALTSFAGSIGIIGIALIFAVSQGMTGYIKYVQEETLSAYPLTIQAEHQDLAAMLQAFMDAAKASGNHENDAVYEKTALFDLVYAFNSQETKQNDLKSFKKWLDEQNLSEESPLKDSLNGYQYGYNFDLQVYTKTVDDKIIKSDTEALMSDLILKFMGGNSSMSSMGKTSSAFGMASSALALWQELLPGKNGESVNPIITSQYEQIVEGGRWPESYNEIVLVVDKNNEIDDMTLFALGLKSEKEINDIVDSALNNKKPTKVENKWSYEEILGMDFRVILNSDCYDYNPVTGVWEDLSKTETGVEILYDNKGLDLKVVGIVRPNENAMAESLTGSIYYTYKLTDYVIDKNKESEALKAQLNSLDTDIFTGLPFKDGGRTLTDEEKSEKLINYVAGLNILKKAEVYARIKSVLTESDKSTALATYEAMFPTREKKEGMLVTGIMQATGMKEDDVKLYLSKMDDKGVNLLFEEAVINVAKIQKTQRVKGELAGLTPQEIADLLDGELPTYSVKDRAIYYGEALEFSENSYDDNLKALGYVDKEIPSSVRLYMSTFEGKDIVEGEIKKYNEAVGQEKAIGYNDYVGTMMASVTTIIDVITYVLIAFVAISLVVSSIMIGVITLISVQERTKEIGILRAIGASKKNVSAMFNAETVIVGFSAGLLGVCVTYLLCILVNVVLSALTGLTNLQAVLPIPVALILIGISVLLTLVAGIIPSRSASKKDPVIALRTE